MKNLPRKMLQLSTKYTKCTYRENQVTLSHFEQLPCRDLPFTSAPENKLGSSFLIYRISIIKGFYPENQGAFLPSLLLIHSVHTHRPWLKVTMCLYLQCSKTLKAHTGGTLQRKICFKFPSPCPSCLSSLLNS